MEILNNDIDKIKRLIQIGNETYKVDFKEKSYPLGKHPKRNEILKDIMAFANQTSDEEKFLIIGVRENEDNFNEKIVGIQVDNEEDSKYQELVQTNIEPQINFEFIKDKIGNRNIAYFKIFDNEDRPYLFKKNVINAETKKQDFKYGDGYIRVGTSTRKIGRREIELILQEKDRKKSRINDIIIKPVVGKVLDDELKPHNLIYLDVDIENISNQSIDLDVQLKIEKSSEDLLVCKSELLRYIDQEQRKDKDANRFFNLSYLRVKPFRVPNINVAYEETPNEIVLSLNLLNRNNCNLTLKQNSSYKDVFEQSLILLEKNKTQYNAEVIIKSDDFSDGELIKRLTFNIG